MSSLAGRENQCSLMSCSWQRKIFEYCHEGDRKYIVVFCISDLIASFQCLGKWCYCIAATKVSCFQTAAKLLQDYMLVVQRCVRSLQCSWSEVNVQQKYCSCSREKLKIEFDFSRVPGNVKIVQWPDLVLYADQKSCL